MRLLLAADSLTTLDILIEELTARSWPSETEVRILSIIEDHEVPLQTCWHPLVLPSWVTSEEPRLNGPYRLACDDLKLTRSFTNQRRQETIEL
jgi:hypothetical protein